MTGDCHVRIRGSRGLRCPRPPDHINPALYALSLGASKGTTGFRDILTGNNDFPPISGYSAGHGWDAASGLGSPIATDLVAALANK